MTIAKTLNRARSLVSTADPEKALPEGALPCRSCGVAVHRPTAKDVETVTIYPRVPYAGAATFNPVEIKATRCAACAERRDRAEALLLAHPAVARANGNVGVDRLDAALAAFDAIGDRRGRLAGSLTSTDEDIRELIEVMAPLGGAVAWSAGYAYPNQCEARRWAHVPDILTGAIKDAHAALIRRRNEPSWPFSPPSINGALQGCGLCGVGTLEAKESKALDAWGEEFELHTGTLGGATRPEPVKAHLCPACRRAVASVGFAVGMPAVWAAVIRFRGYDSRTGWTIDSMSGVVAWAALRPGTKPNNTPWEHVNLTALDAELAVSPYVRKREAR